MAETATSVFDKTITNRRRETKSQNPTFSNTSVILVRGRRVLLKTVFWEYGVREIERAGEGPPNFQPGRSKAARGLPKRTLDALENGHEEVLADEQTKARKRSLSTEQPFLPEPTASLIGAITPEQEALLWRGISG
jgi:hypothetical protein